MQSPNVDINKLPFQFVDRTMPSSESALLQSQGDSWKLVETFPKRAEKLNSSSDYALNQSESEAWPLVRNIFRRS